VAASPSEENHLLRVTLLSSKLGSSFGLSCRYRACLFQLGVDLRRYRAILAQAPTLSDLEILCFFSPKIEVLYFSFLFLREMGILQLCEVFRTHSSEHGSKRLPPI